MESTESQKDDSYKNISPLQELLDEFKKIKKENSEMSKRIKNLESITSNNNLIHVNNNVNNGTINNSNVNIHLVAFGKEKMNFVIDDIAKICQ